MQSQPLILTVLILLLTIPASAEPILLGPPTYGGSGCPAGSLDVALSPDQQILELTFSQFRAEVHAGQSIDRKNCDLAIPARVPQGYSVAIGLPSFSGFAELAAGTQAEAGAEVFFAGQGRGIRESQRFSGPFSGEVTMPSAGEPTQDLQWSSCGESTILRVNSWVSARAGKGNGNASIELSHMGQLPIHWRRCQ